MDIKATVVFALVCIAIAAVLIGSIVAMRGSRRRMAPIAGMLMLLGAFFAADPPPPPKSESIARDEADEDAAGDPDEV